MSEPNPIAEIFPGHGDRIEKLRLRDPAFDELCADFEDLYNRIPAAARSYGDALESLQGLEHEIRNRISDREPKKPSWPSSTQKDPTSDM